MSGNPKSITDKNGIAVIKSDVLILTGVESALDLIGDICYNNKCNKIVVFKENIAEDFFVLATGKLGEVLQKFATYGVRLAIVGDFSVYKSKPLKDFIYESNSGRHIYFADNEQTAIDKLSKEI